jgi:hypothetical protein
MCCFICRIGVMPARVFILDCTLPNLSVLLPPPCHLQVQFSLLDRRPLNGMVQYCQQRGIKLFTYGSVGGGLLSDKYVEEPKKGLFGGGHGQSPCLHMVHSADWLCTPLWCLVPD